MSDEQQDNNESMTIEEHMESFKKHLWSHGLPMQFATDVVEELLLEIQRQRTVMRAAVDELDEFWEVHRQAAEKNERVPQLVNLMHSLNNKRKGFYAQYLSQAEYREFIHRSTNMENISKQNQETE